MRRSLLILLCCLALGATVGVGLWGGLSRLLLPAHDTLEAAANERDIARIDASLDTVRHEVSARVADYAVWGQTYAYLSGRNPRYIDVNYDEAWFDNYNIDLFFFVDAQRRLAWGRTRTPSGLVEERALFGAVTADVGAADATPEEPASGVLSTPHGMLLYAAAPATNDERTAPYRGLVVIGRYITAADLAQLTQLRVSLISTRDPDVPAFVQGQLQELARTDATRLDWEDDQSLHALIALRDGVGRVVGGVQTDRAREMRALGLRTLTITAATYGVLLLAGLAGFWVWLQRPTRLAPGAPTLRGAKDDTDRRAG